MGHLKICKPVEQTEVASEQHCPVCNKQIWEPFTYDESDDEWFNIAKDNIPAIVDMDGDYGEAIHKIEVFHYFDYCVHCGTCVS